VVESRKSGPAAAPAAREAPTVLRLTIGDGRLRLEARLERERAPRTAAAVEALLPFRGKILQGRWSGESAWVPLGDWRTASTPGGGGGAPARRLDVPYENLTSYPAPGELLLYCFGQTVDELLLAYGPTVFQSRVGLLAGNHFATVLDARERLAELGRLVLWEGAQDVLIELADGP
jgi:hypothetical protein